MLACVCTVAVLASLLGAGHASAHPRSCRNVVIRNADGSIYTRTHALRAKRVGCRRARKIAHARLVDDGAGKGKYRGFECRSSASGVHCHRHRKRVSWRYAAARTARAAETRAGATVSGSKHYCSNSFFASGFLQVRGVSCGDGGRIVKAAARYHACVRGKPRPGRGCPCHVTRSEARSGGGCRGRVHVHGWRCKGLFPGEGFDIKCRRGRKLAHGGAGG